MLYEFVKESNKIETIHREPTDEEMQEADRFLELKKVTTKEVIQFVKVYQPNAVLRDRYGLNVYVGSYTAPAGGKRIKEHLDGILWGANSGDNPFIIHQHYEHLHPFTDGNGRSGRMLWLWQMKRCNRLDWVERFGFLRSWYYQSLENFHNNPFDGLK